MIDQICEDERNNNPEQPRTSKSPKPDISRFLVGDIIAVPPLYITYTIDRLLLAKTSTSAHYDAVNNRNAAPGVYLAVMRSA